MGHDVQLPVEPPLLVGGLLAAFERDPGVGAEHVDRSETLLGRGNERLHRPRIGHVAIDREPPEFVGHRPERFGLEVRHRDPLRPLPGEAPGERPARSRSPPR